MHSRLCLCVISALFATICFSQTQTPSPAFSYTLHAQKVPTGWSLIPKIAPPFSVLALAPDNALLVVIPQAGEQWVLKRVKGWDTPSPQELTLALGGDPPDDHGTWIMADLTVNPDGSYLIVRIIARNTSINHEKPIRQTVVMVVDLSKFSIVSRRVTTDPLIADSQWRFNQHGLLISRGFAKSVRIKSDSLLTVTATSEAAALTLPNLKPVADCHYNRISERRDGGHWTSPPRGKEADVDCAAVLEAAEVSSVDDLPGGDHALDRISKLLNMHGPIEAVSKGEKFALCRCGTGYSTWYDTYKITSRTRTVLSIPDKHTVLSIPLPFKQPVDGALATINGQNYLLLLRDGIKLETYRFP